jgi:chorismate-pyruvate lyase
MTLSPSATGVLSPRSAAASETAVSSSTHFGDIMGWRATSVRLPDCFSPLERIVLTANGNLQRIVSSFYNAPVAVVIVQNDRRAGQLSSSDSDLLCFDREVHLTVAGRVFCVARSEIFLGTERLRALVERDRIGIGQLFRHLSLLPEFTLLEAGKAQTCFWRRYALRADGILCHIHEEFPSNLFQLDLSPPSLIL